MNTCPHCGAEPYNNATPNLFDCGTFINVIRDIRRSALCNYIEDFRRPLDAKLQAAKARIEALVKVGDAIIENGSVSERLANEWNKAKANNL